MRHGKPVGIWKEEDEASLKEKTKELIAQLKKEDYKTIALICKDEDEAEELKDLAEDITVLPLALTKGLEFDAVVLYNPSRNRYADSDRDAKLLYVAVTRALHELHLVYTGELCELLK